jgi:hypothetical protein
MHDRLIRLSKYLAKYLRHALHELGLTLQPGGWVPVDDLLAAARKHGFPISYDELVKCVETNDKRRFAFDVSGEMIRASQGHSEEPTTDSMRDSHGPVRSNRVTIELEEAQPSGESHLAVEGVPGFPGLILGPSAAAGIHGHRSLIQAGKGGGAVIQACSRPGQHDVY